MPQTSIKRYVFQRIIEAIPLIFGVIVVNFMIIHLAPGDPVYVLMGEVGGTPEYEQMIIKLYGLDKPVVEQLVLYLGNVLQGNLGYSFIFHEPVSKLIIERLSFTMVLMISSLLLAIVIGLILGILSSIKPYHFVDTVTSLLSTIGYSMPSFWLGQIFIIVFALYLRWLPVGGTTTFAGGTYLYGLVDFLRHLILPALTLSAYYLAFITRLTRASMLEELRKDYITMARAKGMPERRVLVNHALRNAILPVVSMVGTFTSLMLAGAVVVETVFAWPGLGRLTFDAILKRDYPLLMGMFIAISLLIIIVNIITDLIYSLLEPRIRYK